MTLIIKLFGVLMLFAGIVLLINPEIIIDWIANNKENTSLYLAAIVVRFVFGILFIIAAKESKYPQVFKIFGTLFIIAAIIFVFMGQKSFQNFINSLIPDVTPFAPVAGLLSIAFGGFLIYAFSRNKELLQE